MGEREVHGDLPGPADGVKANQQNNGLLCHTLPSLSQEFLATSASSAPTYKVTHPHQKMKVCLVLICCCSSKADNRSMLITHSLHLLFTTLWIELSLHLSYHIIHFFPSSFCFSSPSLPCLSPLVYWFSRLRIPRVEDCNTQASNYFGVCLFAFPLHLFGLCL